MENPAKKLSTNAPLRSNAAVGAASSREGYVSVGAASSREGYVSVGAASSREGYISVGAASSREGYVSVGAASSREGYISVGAASSREGYAASRRRIAARGRSHRVGVALGIGLLYMLVAAASTGDAANPLVRFLDGLQTFQADFVQTAISAGHSAVRTSQGTFYLSRPGRFRWNYSDPAGQEVVADGSRVWLYDPELVQVSHQAQKEALRGTPALLLSDTAPIERHFEVVDLGMRAGLDWIELIPRADNSEITKVEVAFDGQKLDRLEMIDNFGQITRFLFRHVQRNPKLPQGLFRFDPPPEVDILGR